MRTRSAAQPTLFLDPPTPDCSHCGHPATPNHWLVCRGVPTRLGPLPPVGGPVLAEAERRPLPDGAVEGAARRADGHARVEAAMDPEALEAVWALWHGLCLRHAEVASDMLWAAAPPALLAEMAAHPNTVGNLVRQSAATRHWVVDAGRTCKTTRAIGNRRKLTVWRSLIYQGA